MQVVNLTLAPGQTRTGKDFLTGNFAPVHDEVHYESCEVEGKLPKELEGAYLRTGRQDSWFDEGS